MREDPQIVHAAGANVEVGVTEVMQRRAQVQSNITAAVADVSDRARAMHLIMSQIPVAMLEGINLEILRAPEHRDGGAESNLVSHARNELQRAGLFSVDADYEGMVAEAVVELIQHFAAQGHSGESAVMTLYLFNILAHYDVLTPLTDDPTEWVDQSEVCGEPMWQSRRKPSCFSKDGGKTWYDIDTVERPDPLVEMEARKDAAYYERNQLVAALSKLFPAGVARTAIEGWEPAWHNCVYIDLPTGQASWHFHDSQAHLFAHLPPYEKPWDGHTTEEKYSRLAALDGANIVCYYLNE